jgi:hypothetical protein
MSTRSSGISIRRYAHAPRRRGRYFVLCLDNGGYEASLEARKVYVAVPDADAERHDQLRVIDESGEDYLFPAARFVSVAVSPTLRRRLLAAV